MRAICITLLSLFIIAQLGHGDPPPTIELPPNNTLEVVDPVVAQTGSSVTVSGRVKRSIPWGETGWDHIEISLYDENGSLILEVATDYSPRPILHPYRSAYEPRSRFAVKIKGVTRRVHSVRIACLPGSVSQHKPSDPL
jgi:hypothetical protein